MSCATKADEDYDYEKDFVLLNLVDTDLPGLYLVEVSEKTVVQQVQADGGDSDQVHAKFGVALQGYNTQRRRKLQTDIQSQDLWGFCAGHQLSRRRLHRRLCGCARS